MRAVHWFQEIFFALHTDRIELGGFVVRIVPGRFVQLQISNVRCDNLLVATLFLLVSQKLFERATDHRTIWKPKRQTGPNHSINQVDPKFLSKFLVIPFFCFLQLMQILFQLFLLWKCDAIDPGKLLSRNISPPIRARNAKQLYRFDGPCVRNMRTPA